MNIQPTTSAQVVPFAGVRHSDAWRRWSYLTRSDAPFLAPEFFTLTRPLAERGDAILAEAWDAERLVGALPLVVSGRVLRAMRSEQSPGFDFRGTPEGLEAIWRALKDDDRWDLFFLKNVPRESLLATRLVELARDAGYPVVMHPDARHLYFDVPGFESRISSKFRANLRRCERKLGGVELERITQPKRSDIDDAMAIEAMAWKGAAGTSIATEPAAVHLYGATSRLFGKRGKAALSFVRADGKRIAMLMSVESDDTLYALKIGYNPDYAVASPGHLVVWKVAEDAERRGLQKFDFVGREDDWKHKWTDQVHEQVSLTIYRRSPRALALYGFREKLEPWLRTELDDLRTPLRRQCQRADVLGEHSLTERARERIDRGFGIKSGVRRLLAPAKAPPKPLGPASRFEPGAWVRVLDEDRLRATLDDQSRLHGLAFVPTQWETCGRVYRVQQRVQRIRDDRGKMRPISRTVLLENATCAGHGPQPAGCGRNCPLMFRDDWLEPAEPPRREPPGASRLRHAHVRELEEIRAGLDLHGRRDGLTFMPEMAAYTGKRFRVLQPLTSVFEHDSWIAPHARIYLLEGLNCTGATPGGEGPCHRACALLWHEDWLQLDPEGAA